MTDAEMLEKAVRDWNAPHLRAAVEREPAYWSVVRALATDGKLPDLPPPAARAEASATDRAPEWAPRPEQPPAPALDLAVLRRARSCWFSEKPPGCCSGYTCHLRGTWVDPARDCRDCAELPP